MKLKHSLVALVGVLLAGAVARAGVGDVTGGFIRFSDGLADDTYTIMGERVDIGIVDADANASATVRETIGPFAVTATGGDTVSVLLQEVLPNGGFFRIVQVDGASQAGFDISDTIGKIVQDRILFAGDGDTFTFFYTSGAGADTLADTAIAVAKPTAATIAFVAGSSTSTVTPSFYETQNGQSGFADTIFIRVVDADRNVNPLGKDTILVVVRNVVTNDSEHIRLLETTDTSGIFICVAALASDTLVASTTIGPLDNDGTLFAFFDGGTPVDSITVIYTDTANGDFAQETNFIAFPVGATGLLTTAAGDTEADSGTIPGRVYPLVVDVDENKNPAVKDTVGVAVSSAMTGDSETVTLVEIGVNFGVFFYDSGLQLSDTSGRNISGDNILFAAKGDTLTMLYRDPDNSFDTATDTVTVRRTNETAVVQFLGDTFDFSVSPDTRAVGESLALGVRDGDRNDSPLASDSFTVHLQVLQTGDYETVTLRERFTGTGSGTSSDTNGTFLSSGFTIWVSDTIGLVANDSALWAANGNTIVITYIDSGTTRADSITVVRLASVSTTTIFDTAGNFPDTLAVRQYLRVRVNDPDRNLSVTVPDTVYVTLTALLTGDTTTVLLTETSATSGIFLNFTDTIFLSDTYGLASSDTRILMVRVGDSVGAFYSDTSSGSDSSFDTIGIIAFDSRPAFATLLDTGFSVSPDSFAVADSRIAFQVTDLNRNHNPQGADTLLVVVFVPRTGDSLVVRLTETTDTSGVFRSTDTITISDTGAIVTSDSILFGGYGDTLLVTYTDSDASADSALDTAMIHRNASSGTVALMSDTPPVTAAIAFGPDSTVYFRLFDPNANRDVKTAETGSVVLRSVVTGDTLSVTLTETAVASGILIGRSVLSDSAAPSLADTLLSVAATDTIVVRWTDPFFPADIVEDTKSVSTPSRAGTISFARGFVMGTDAQYFTHADSLFVRVMDRDRNLSPATRDSVSVTIFSRTASGDTIDSVTLLLPEVSREDSATLDTGAGAFANPDTPIRLSTADSPVQGDTTLSIALDSGTIYVLLSATAPDTAFDTATIFAPGATAVLTLVDSSFVSADTYRIGDTVHLSLADSDLNKNPGIKDSVTLTLVGSTDTAIVILIETSETSGIFRSRADSTLLSLDTGLGNADVLFVGVGESFVVTIFDTNGLMANVSDSATVVAKGVPSDTVNFIDTTLARATRVRLGDTIGIQAYGPNLPNSGLIPDTVIVSLFSWRTGDSETLTCTETTNTSLLFRALAGIRVTAESSASIGDGRMAAGVGETIQVTMVTTTGTVTDTVLVETVAVTAQAAVFLDTSGAVITQRTIGLGFIVSIRDTGLNSTPLAKDSFTLMFTTAQGRDSATVRFTESTETSSTFLSDTVILIQDGVAYDPTDTNLEVVGGDTVYASLDGNTTGLNVLFTTTTSTLTSDTRDIVANGLFGPGDTITGVVSDADENENPLATETVVITIRSLFDTVVLTLTEGSTDSSFFRHTSGAAVTLRFSTAPSLTDTTLEVVDGDSVAVIYTDADTTADADTDYFLVRLTPTTATCTASRSATSQAKADTLLLGETVFIWVLDANANKDGALRDTLLVTLLVTGTNDSTTILLTETSDSTNLFRYDTGIFVESAAVPANSDSKLEAFFGDTLTAFYTDAVWPSDSTTAVVGIRPDSLPSANVTVTFTDAQGTALTSFTIGDTFYVKVVLVDAGGTPFSSTTIDTFRIYVFSNVTHDSELVILTESAIASLSFNNNANSGSTPGPLATRLTDGSVTLSDGLLELSAVGLSAFGGAAFAGQAFSAQATSDGDSIGASSPDLPGLQFGQIVVVAAQVTSASNIVVYPNPYRPNDNNAMTGSSFTAGNFTTGILFGNMPATWRMRIFALDGRLVAERNSDVEGGRGRIQGGVLYQFDARNDFGDPIASGIYLFSIETNVGTKTGKFAVIR